MGAKPELLQKYVFILLDIFIEYQHNINIRERRDAWLTLLTCDEPCLPQKSPLLLFYKETPHAR